MKSVREILESIQLLCWNTTEADPIEDKVQEYLRSYPHLRTPATIDLLRQTIKQWQRIQQLEQILKQTDDPKEQAHLIFRLNQLQKTWLTMLGNLGITYTRQQYKSSKKRVQPPLERLKMLKKGGKSPRSRQTGSKQPNEKEHT